MKKIATLILVVLAFSLSGCMDAKTEKNEETVKQENTKKNIFGDGKIKKLKPGESIGGL